ncbi:hypothetical protein ABIE89_003229 [Bradyrhizobium niftali]|uniref:DUF3551 domain-containing protein n=1 Tax=Bradyrhizobium niftali TaxID=2560055 RepID=UPI0038365ADA
MKKMLAGTLGIVVLAGAACLEPTEPVAAHDYAFCRQDASSGMRSCDFETMEQCLAMISGRGGSCTRDPYLTQSGQSYAYAPKRDGRPHR